jgi:ABC-type Fe3+-hydroxamate transport system substrate-binding protein
MPVIATDQLGHTLELPFPPTRIISLVPSQTEFLHDLGLDTEVVGITKFCVHPPGWRKTKTLIGGTKKFNFEVIDRLKPDLIIGNKEENYKEGIALLRHKYPVWMSDIVTPEDAFSMMRAVGAITGKPAEAERLMDDIRSSFNGIKEFKGRKKRVLYLIWRNPWMGAATHTFIHEMLTLAGFENCLKERERYPELAATELTALNPDLVFLSSEPYPFSGKHVGEVHTLLPRAKVLLVDGELFSWYGSRMRHFASYLATLPLS